MESFKQSTTLRCKLEDEKSVKRSTQTITNLVFLVVMGGYSCSKGREFESRHHILDGHFFHLCVCSKFLMYLKRHKKT